MELGSGDYFFGNNTFLLEKYYDWNGVSIDINEELVTRHNKKRKNKCILKNGIDVDYLSLFDQFDFPKNIDYLQLDCDPTEITFEVLKKIPFNSYKFAIITYEHDFYCDKTKSFQNKSEDYLKKYGYLRLVNNISLDNNNMFEDWYVHPDLVDKNIINKMKCIGNKPNYIINYFFKNHTYF